MKDEIKETLKNFAIAAGEKIYDFSIYLSEKSVELFKKLKNKKIKAGIGYLELILTLLLAAQAYKGCEKIVTGGKEKIERVYREITKEGKEIKALYFDNIYDFYENFKNLNNNEKDSLIKGYLKYLWDIKCSKSYKPEDCKNLEDRILRGVRIEKSSIDKLRKEISKVIKDVNKKIDDKSYKITIDPNLFIAIAMTELFPLIDGEKNLNTLEGLLEEGGIYLLEWYPAIYDGYISFGKYQLTYYIVSNDGKRRGNANIIAEMLGIDVPSSMINIKSREEQHKLAYLNMLFYIFKVPKEKTKPLFENKEDCAVFLAIAHHSGPSYAEKIIKEWDGKKPIFELVKNNYYTEKFFENYCTLNPKVKESYEKRLKEELYKSFKKIKKGYLYIVEKGDNLSKIAKKFNEWDEEFNKDRYKEITGKDLDKWYKRNIYPGQKIIIWKDKILKRK